MYHTTDFKKGLKILIDGEPYVITHFEHVKPGKGNQFTRTKLKNLINRSNLERTFKSGEKFHVPNVEIKEMTFLYKDDNRFNFMNQENYEQISMSSEEIGENINFLHENLNVNILFFNEKAIDVEVPNSVNLKVIKSDPGIKGNTATGATKPATLETGLTIQVPLHINEGDTLRIDTRDISYVERVNN